MIIESVLLKNIKSYDDQGCVIDFRPGVNLIWGENGSGKTTILEAIGFCLFDALDYKFEQFIRESATEGEAILTFKHFDGRSYAIVREIRNTAGLKIKDVATGRDIFTRRKDAEDWLNDQLGVEFGKYGKDLFKNAIGVAQNSMTGVFALSAGSRKKIFDPILRVDEYEQAFKNLLDTKNYLDNLLHGTQRELSHLIGRLEQLPLTKEHVEDLVGQIRIGERDLEMAQEQEGSLRGELSILDETFRKLGELDNKFLAASNMITSLAAQLEPTLKGLEEAHQAEEIIIAARQGHEKYDRTKKELAGLEIRQVEANRLEVEVQEVELVISRLTQQTSGLIRDLTEVEVAEKRILELQPGEDTQTELEIQRNIASDQLRERDRILREAEENKTYIQEKKKSLEILGAQLITRARFEEELSEKSIGRESTLSVLQEINVKLSKTQAERGILFQQLQQALLDKQSWEAACRQLEDLAAEIKQEQQTLDRLEQQVLERNCLEQDEIKTNREKEDRLAKLTEAQQELALCKHQLNELKNHLSLLQTAESAECPVCRRSLSDIEREYVEADFNKDEQAWSHRLELAQTATTATRPELDRIDREVQEIQDRLKKLPSEIQVNELKGKIGEKNNRLLKLINKTDGMAGVVQTAFDLQSRIDTIELSLDDLTNKKEELENQRNKLDQAIALINQNISALPTEAVKKTTEEEVHHLETRIEIEMSTAKKMAGAEQDLENANRQLAILGDPRTELNRLSGIASRKSTLEDELRASEREKEACLESQKMLSEQLLGYASLMQDIIDKKSVLSETEQDYRDYERNIQTALTLGERQLKVTELRKQHAEQVNLLDHLEIEKSRIGSGYDPVYHGEIQKNLDYLLSRVTTLSAQVGEWQKQLDATREELSNLEKLNEQLREKEQEVERLEHLKGVFEFVRNTIRRASPDIVSRRVRAVSITADRIFQDILGDLMLTLAWDETYAVKVHSGQIERAFEQLSGGEQMAASIAVRLALLLHMASSNIRWLFLDEPTANMDDKRRDKLADRITRLDQLDQIFVITHDDAFDRDTHHLIEVSKQDGISYARGIR